MKKLQESRQQFYSSLCKEWGSVTQNTSMVSGTLKTKAKHQTHSFPSAFNSHTARAMEKDDSEQDCQLGQLHRRLRLQFLELMEVFIPEAVSLPRDWVVFAKSHCFYGILDELIHGSGMMPSWTGLLNNLDQAHDNVKIRRTGGACMATEGRCRYHVLSSDPKLRPPISMGIC